MITVKLPITCSNETKEQIKLVQRQQNCVVRWAFNRFHEGLNEKEIRVLSKELNNINNLDSWLIQSGIGKANDLYKTGKVSKIIFGGKFNFFQRLKNKLTKETWKQSRTMPICSVGEGIQSGNRKFKLQVIENNTLIWKYKCKEHFEVTLPKLRKNMKNMLSKLQINMENREQPVSVQLSQDYVWLTFEESLVKPGKKSEGNYVGLDLNPNYIACSLFNKDKQLQQSWSFDLKQLTNGNQNKLQHETIEIAKQINKLCVKNQVDFVFMEDLNMKTSDLNKGKHVNRLCNNSWPRNLFTNNLKKRLNI